VGALEDVPAMRAVLGLFEGVVTGAADGYARMRGQPAATLLHPRPGLAHGCANLHNARKARSPIVSLIGNRATSHLALDAPLTTDVEAVARPFSTWVRTIHSPVEAGADAAAATGARVACEKFNARHARGAGRLAVPKLPYIG